MTNGVTTESSKPQAEAKAPRGRPRSEHSHEAILESVLRLLEDEGYGALTIEGVARHAGVGKQTIYRWWKCKAELVLEAYANHAASKLPVPDRGSLRADLEAYLTAGFKRLTDITAPVMRGLMADAVHDEEFRAVLLSAFISKRTESLKLMFERAMARGEVAAATDLDFACELIYGPMWYRLLLQNGRLDARFARQLTAAVMAAVKGCAPAPEGNTK